VTEGSGAWGGYPSGSGVPPAPEKLQRTSNTIVLPLIFGNWFGVFPISTRGVSRNLFFLGGISFFGGIKLLNSRSDVIFTT